MFNEPITAGWELFRSIMDDVPAHLAQLHPGLHHIGLYQLSGCHCRETLQVGKKCGAQVADG